MNATQLQTLLSCLERISDVNISAPANAYTGFAARHEHDDHDHVRVHDDEHDHDNNNHELLIAKVVAAVTLLCASALCGTIPFLLNRWFKWTENNANARSAITVKCLLYFGGGVLLCTTFLHLLPEVQETVEQLQECGILPKLSFAFAEMLMCCGFFLMFFVEELIHAIVHRHKSLLHDDEGAGAAFQRGHSGRNSTLIRGSKRKALANGAEHTATKQENIKTVMANDVECCTNSSNVTTASVQDLVARNNNNNNSSKHAAHSHLPSGIAGDGGMITSSLRGFFIVLALSLHELFEGMAIGLEGSASSVWFMFGAVSAHKLVLAFCVGVELIVARTRISLSVVYVFTFAVVSPIGIGIGILISHNSHDSMPSVPSAILQGLACGTLLYVVFFEILSKENSGLIAYLALFVGFAVMFGLQQLGAGEHGHTHGSCGTHSHEHSHDEESAHTPAAHADISQLSLEQQLHILRKTSASLLQNANKLN